MNNHVYTSPAGAGKTTTVIQEIIHLKRTDPFAPVWVLLPTRLQISTFRNRLLDAAGNAYLGVQFFTFYDLYTYLLDLMQIPQKRVDQSSVYRVMRSIVNQEKANLTYFTPIADKPGFVDILVRFIFELKQAHVPPEDFEAYAAQTPDPKDDDIARIYHAYQHFLRENDLVDREGAGWLALASLEKDHLASHVRDKNIALLVVDGFTQFSPLQARLLNTLKRFSGKTLLTLTHENERATTIHRSYERTLQRLTGYDDHWAITPLLVNNIWQAPELTYLEEHFMSEVAEPIPAGDSLHCIEAPSRAAEVRMVLREVKRLLLAGESPEQIIILARDMNPYIDLVRSVAVRYRVPMIFREGITLAQNPAVSAILDLLTLHTGLGTDFRRQAVLDLLRMPYFATPFSDEDVNALERISLRFKVIGGRDQWLDAVELALHEQQEYPLAPLVELDEDDESLTATPPISDDLYVRLLNFFRQITPPATATPREYVIWLESLLGPDTEANGPPGNLQFFQCVRNTVDRALSDTIYETNQAVITRDLYALREFRKCVLDLLSAYELVKTEPIPWHQFMSDLEKALRFYSSDTVGPQYRTGHVLATTVFDARGLPHDHVFIMGLAEGSFPAQRSEDPLYSERERQWMNRQGIPVPTTEHEEDDTSIFYTCAAMAQQCLTISRPTIDSKANPWTPSILWQATTTLLRDAPVSRETAGMPPSFASAADENELAVAYASHVPLNRQPSGPPSQVPPSRWENIALSRHIEVERRRGQTKYSGMINNPELRRFLIDTLDENHVWSATQFNEYAVCPFRFFARRMLMLEQFQEPVEGLDVMQLGTLQHEILEYIYRRFQHTEMPIIPEQLDHALDILYTRAEDVFKDAPRRLHFSASAVWSREQEEILRRLEALVRADFENNETSPFHDKAGNAPRYIFAVELPFGLLNSPPAIVDGASGPIRTRGKIDRIDRVGDRLYVIDYKSGSNLPTVKQLEEARNFQMMIYLLAAHQQLDASFEIGGGLFWSIRRPDKFEWFDADDEAIATAQIWLHDYVASARAGDFSVSPSRPENGKCMKYCEFTELCRFSRQSIYG